MKLHDQPKLSRKERLEKKYKNLLRCENCNRWTVVSYEKWKYETSKENGYIFLCRRPRCLLCRSEVLLPLKDRKETPASTS